MRILAVEDDAVTMRVIVSVLEKAGHEVSSATTVAGAIDVLEKQRLVDVIISDIMLPGGDGFGLLRHLKGHARLKNTPILVCSALNDRDTIRKVAEFGVRHFVTKPIVPDMLLKKLDSISESRANRVLIIDDEPTILEILARILRRAGYTAVPVQTAEEGLQQVQTERPDLVITDLALPGMSGDEFLKAIRAEYPCLPVVVVTGQRKDGLDREMQKIGASGFIRKPFRSSDVLSTVQQLLGGSKTPVQPQVTG